MAIKTESYCLSCNSIYDLWFVSGHTNKITNSKTHHTKTNQSIFPPSLGLATLIQNRLMGIAATCSFKIIYWVEGESTRRCGGRSLAIFTSLEV